MQEEQANAEELHSYIEEESCSPVHLDILAGDCNYLRELQAMGADLNKIDAHNRTPAYWLAKVGNIKQLKLLKTLGADFELGKLGETPANIATEKEQIEVLTLFNEWGLKLDKPGQYDISPIHVAALYGNIDLLELFRIWGLNMEVPNHNGQPPIYIAALNRQYEVLKLFHSFNLKLDTPFPDGSTIVHIAAEGDLKALELYRQWKIPLDTRNAIGNPPIYYAVIFRKLNILEAFKEWGEDLNLRMENGATLMYTAANEGFLEIVKFLIKHNPEQAIIPARFTPEFFFSSITSRYKDDEEIKLRAVNKVKERSQVGDPDSKIRLLPIDIAEVLGYSDIVAELKGVTPNISLARIAGLGFLQPKKERSNETVDSTQKESPSKEKEKTESTDNTSAVKPSFFNSSTELKDSASTTPKSNSNFYI